MPKITISYCYTYLNVLSIIIFFLIIYLWTIRITCFHEKNEMKRELENKMYIFDTTLSYLCTLMISILSCLILIDIDFKISNKTLYVILGCFIIFIIFLSFLKWRLSNINDDDIDAFLKSQQTKQEAIEEISEEEYCKKIRIEQLEIQNLVLKLNKSRNKHIIFVLSFIPLYLYLK